MSKYYYIQDGEWVLVSRRKRKHMCCDCALVEIVDIRDTKDGTEMRFRRDARATAVARRNFKFTRED